MAPHGVARAAFGTSPVDVWGSPVGVAIGRTTQGVAEQPGGFLFVHSRQATPSVEEGSDVVIADTIVQTKSYCTVGHPQAKSALGSDEATVPFSAAAEFWTLIVGHGTTN